VATGAVATGGLYWYINGGPSSAGTLTLGSNASDTVPRQAMQAVVDAFTARTGIPVRVNTSDPNSFQDRISTYLQTTPDDVFTWFAGYRMRFFADQGLAGDVSDVWQSIAANYSDAVRAPSTGSNGRQYFVPFFAYPWALIYRRSVWQQRGYAEPQTFDELLALCARMQQDGLIPLAFANKDGWPSMGTFDALNMRLNGYDFHLRLLAGQESWTDQRVVDVLDTWRALLPFQQVGAEGRTWQEGAQTVISGQAGMIFLGTYAAEQASPADRDDMAIFQFPRLGTTYDSEQALDAPINGFMMSSAPHLPDAARQFLAFVATGEAQNIYVSQNTSRVAIARDANTSGYTQLQQQAMNLMTSAGRIAQFFDRDTRPDFAGPQGMQAFFSEFLADPAQDLNAFVGRVQAYWNSLG